MSSDPMKDMMAHLTVLSDICQSEGDQTPEGKAAMDNPIDSVAWLANALAPLGGSLKAGQVILTGTFTKPPAANKGDRFETHFSGLGTVTASFA